VTNYNDIAPPNKYYSSNRIDGSTIEPEEPSAVERLGDVATGQRRPTRYRLPYFPVGPGSVLVTDPYPMTDDGMGKLRCQGNTVGEINYKTGVIETHDPLVCVPLKVSWHYNPNDDA